MATRPKGVRKILRSLYWQMLEEMLRDVFRVSDPKKLEAFKAKIERMSYDERQPVFHKPIEVAEKLAGVKATEAQIRACKRLPGMKRMIIATRQVDAAAPKKPAKTTKGKKK